MTGAQLRVLVAAAVVLAALMLSLLLDSLGASQVLFWMNSSALILALALGGSVHGAGAPAIYSPSRSNGFWSGTVYRS